MCKCAGCVSTSLTNSPNFIPPKSVTLSYLQSFPLYSTSKQHFLKCQVLTMWILALTVTFEDFKELIAV